MGSDFFAPVADKILHSDGSVTTMAGGTVLPADPARAEEYESRSAAADKWLRPDGSVTDMAGNIIMGADENRALDYANRMAVAIPWFSVGGGLGGDSIWIGTRAEYNALPAGERNDPDTVHFIKEGT